MPFKITKNPDKKLQSHLYQLDIKNKIFTSIENDLYLNFEDGKGWTFNIGNRCIIKTNVGCIFNAGYKCIFYTCNQSIINKCGDNCCILIRDSYFSTPMMIPFCHTHQKIQLNKKGGITIHQYKINIKKLIDQIDYDYQLRDYDFCDALNEMNAMKEQWCRTER